MKESVNAEGNKIIDQKSVNSIMKKELKIMKVTIKSKAESSIRLRIAMKMKMKTIVILDSNPQTKLMPL